MELISFISFIFFHFIYFIIWELGFLFYSHNNAAYISFPSAAYVHLFPSHCIAAYIPFPSHNNAAYISFLVTRRRRSTWHSWTPSAGASTAGTQHILYSTVESQN